MRPWRLLISLALAVAAVAATPKPPKPKAPPLTAEQRAIQSQMKSMSLRDKVAQLVIVTANGDVYSHTSPEFERYRHWIADLHVGGIIINNASQYGLVRNAEPHALAVFLNQMQRLARTPLLVASDFERAASMRVTGGTRFPHSMAFAAAGDLAATKFEGLTAAREARALGIHWIFAPVADVNNNPLNPIINLRSYGEDPEQVSRYVAAYIEGAHSDPANRVLVTAKHFPGHGDTDVDSHLGLPRLEVSRERLDAMELKPFQAAIAHGVDSVMTAHMAVPALEPSGMPATVSHNVLTALLRDELKFKGLIVTDAMTMQGLAMLFDSGEGSVRSIVAGADVLLMPPDPDKAIRAVVGAVEDGRISRQRLDQSVARVLAAKLSLGLSNKKKLVNLDAISDTLDSPEAAEKAQAVADRAVTLIRNDRDVLPLAASSRPCLIVVTELRISQFGQRAIQEFRRRSPNGRVVSVDTGLPLAALQATAGDLTTCSSIVAASFASVSADLKDVKPFLLDLTQRPVPVVLLAFENPYLLTSVPNATSFLTTFSSSLPSEIAAVKALFGEIPVAGHTPVSIPGFAKLGDGIQLPARSR
ncbi:MAG TPA: glycoside hydrolase family 3 protein [Bryobacteraceae bacterium]|jgi:beta-N-acetylhexosaminidase|nr:glycoside hydrolase family 3 protein [Bryobacteraceae bacterium]